MELRGYPETRVTN